MEKIEELLAKLKNIVSAEIKRRLKGLEKLRVKLDSASAEYETTPTDETKEQFDNITEYVKEFEDELIEDLEALVLANEEAEEEKNKQPIEPVVVVPAPVAPIEPDVVEPKPKEESSMGWLGLGVGVVLLVASAGIINTLSKR